MLLSCAKVVNFPVSFSDYSYTIFKVGEDFGVYNITSLSTVSFVNAILSNISKSYQ